MASSEQQGNTGAASTPGDAEVEAAARAVEEASGHEARASTEVVTPAGEMFASNTDDAVVSDEESGDDASAVATGSIPPVPSSGAAGAGAADETAVHGAIPPLLIDDERDGDGPSTTKADAAAAVEGDDAESPTTVGAPASKERIAEAAAAARERVAESTAGARERASESAAHAREKSVEAAAHAREKGAEAAAVAKEKTSKARQRFSAAASEARGRASSAASDARERASNADVKEFAHSTTSLIDTARPFFLAGAAAIFAVLGFLEGDSGVAQVFAIGALLFVIGAAFSGEINAFASSRSQERSRGTRPVDDE